MSEIVSSRSKDDIAAMAPITLVFGATSYQVPVLKIPQERAWRTKLNKVLLEVAGTFDLNLTDTTKKVDISRSLNLQLMEFPEKITQLVFAYAGKSLPRKTVLKESTSEQFVVAFAEIMSVAYPFLGSLAMAIRVTRGTTPELPKSMKFTN